MQDDGSGGEVERLRVLATYGDLGALDGEVSTTAAPPVLPPPEQCVSADQAPPAFLKHASLLERLDLRLDPATTGWALGKPSGNGVIRGWLRMADAREPDPLLLLLAVDALPPVAFELGLPGWTPTLELTAHVRARPAPGWLRMADGREPDPLLLLLAVDALPPVAFELGLPGWTPTLELTAHVRARPAPGWLRVNLTSRTMSGGYLEEDAEVWDSEGRLVALSRQLARASAPAPGRR